jgi:DNA-binding MarR family transcriptional regulator
MAHPQRPARLGFLLSQLGAHATEVFAAHMRSLGITPSEAGVLRIIGRFPGISQRELADKLGNVQSRVVAVIDHLETARLVVRSRSTTDRRVQRLDLTDAGRAIMPALRQAAEAQEAALVDGLTGEQRAQLYELLTTLAALRGLDADVHPGYRAGPSNAGEGRPAE